MGRGCSMDEWVHFERQLEEGRVPNSTYWYVHCRHCADAYAQKQLVNPPTLITGRRTSMHAHLKACPIYGARYKAEQSTLDAMKAQLHTDAATDASGTRADKPIAAPGTDAAATVTATPTNKRKRRASSGEVPGPRGGRGKHCLMEEWTHFTRLLDEGYIGNTNFFHAICNHCQRAYDEAPVEKKPSLVPERLVGRREKLRKHLTECSHFHGELPPMEPRAVVVRSAPRRVVSPTTKTLRADGNVVASAAGVSLADLHPIAAAVASAVLAAKHANAANLRLGLNEWQYFTRLERKPSSSYYIARCNFCQGAYDTAPDALKQSMEVATVIGRKSNMQTHLAKCPHIPKDMLVLEPETSPTASATSEQTGALSAPDELDGAGRDGTSSSLTASKRMRTDSHGDDAPPAAATVDITELSSALLEFTIQHRLPFEWADSESTKKLFRVALAPSVDTPVPNSDVLRTHVLNESYDHVALSELLELKDAMPFPSSAGASHESLRPTMWPVMLHVTTVPQDSSDSTAVPVLHCELTNGKALVPVSSVLKQPIDASSDDADCSVRTPIPPLAYSHGLDIARWLDAHLQQCDVLAHVIPAVIVLPCNGAFARAVTILRARWPRIVFVYDFASLLLFCLVKVFGDEDVQLVVAALAELWTTSASVRALTATDPFSDWQTCVQFVQRLAAVGDESAPLRASAELRAAVDSKVPRVLLERVALVLRTFSTAYASASKPQLTLAATMRHIQALYLASEGFASIQRALEVAWSEMEQPLFVLAHVLHPHLRLSGIAASDVTKLSKLSDLGVTYFTALVGRRATPLRGEVTAYLHRSQPVFTEAFVGEFLVLDDYFRYLSDDYASLSMLMRLLLSLSSVLERTSRNSDAATRVNRCDHRAAERMYSADERKKMAYLIDRCSIKQIQVYSSDNDENDEDATVAAAPKDVVTGETVLAEWREALMAAATKRSAEFSLLEQKYAASEHLVHGREECVEPPGVAMTMTMAAESGEGSDTQTTALPMLAVDDPVAYPPTGLSGDRAKTISLKDLFKPAVEASNACVHV